jgi:tetratricopeptide (TPR) repeat protein
MNDNRELSLGYGVIATALAALLVYALALRNGFAFDDVVLIPNDARVTGAQIGALLTKPYWSDAGLGLYRPLTSLTFALDWTAGSGSTAWFHLSNMIWHALASVGAFLLLAKFFRPAAALAGSMLFALHPVHVEAVANIVGRGELIAATFFFAACLVWTSRDLSRTARTLLTLVCYMCAMLAKESAVVLPAILILIDVAQGERVAGYARRWWREIGALAATLAVFLFLRWLVVGGIAPTRLDPALELTTTAYARWLTALQGWPVFAELLFLPRTLLADYGPRTLLPINEWTPAAVIGLTILIALVAGGLVALLRGNGRWALGLLWFPFTMLPVSNFLFAIGVIVAERTLYLPSFAVCIAAAAAFDAIPGRRYALAIAVAIALGFTVRIVTRIPDWKSTDSIMEALVRDQPESFRGQWHLARMARADDEHERALQLYERAITLWPYREGLVREAAAYGGERGRMAWARNLAQWGTKRWPESVDFHRLLAGHAIDMGDTTAARLAVEAGLRIAPNDTILIQMRRAFGIAPSQP